MPGKIKAAYKQQVATMFWIKAQHFTGCSIGCSCQQSLVEKYALAVFFFSVLPEKQAYYLLSLTYRGEFLYHKNMGFLHSSKKNYIGKF